VSLLQSCASLSGELPNSQKLLGAWLMMDGLQSHPSGCSSPSISYYPEGEYVTFADGGTWDLQGNVLTEIPTWADMFESDDPVILGKPYVSEVSFIGRDRFKKKFSDGNLVEFRRCP
jgi:hypothetical protein